METLKESLLKNIKQTDDEIRPELIDSWMKKWTKSSSGSKLPSTYHINSDGTIDFEGALELVDYFETEIPPYIKFNILRQPKGYNMYDIQIENSALTTLKGLPRFIDHRGRVNQPHIVIKECPFLRNLECITQPLEPERDSIEYSIYDNQKLENLKGLPDKMVKGAIMIFRNENLRSVEGCPSLLSHLSIHDNESLESLDGLKPNTNVKKHYAIYNNGARFSEEYCNSKIKLSSKKLPFFSRECNHLNDDWVDYHNETEWNKPPKDWGNKKRL